MLFKSPLPLIRKKHILIFNIKKFSTEVNVVKSRARPVEIPTNTTITEYLWKNIGKYANNTALVCAETQRSYTYEDLRTKSLSTKKFLTDSLKLRFQDTICVILPNVPEYPIILFGAFQAGLKVTTCNPSYTSDEIKRQLVDSGSSLVFTSKNLLPKVRQALGNNQIPIVTIKENQNEGVTDGVIDFHQVSSGETGEPVDINIEDVVLLPYSSGTTGLPKGVQLTHANILANLAQIVSPEYSLQTESDGKFQDVLPAFLPFFHIYGLVINMLYSLKMGSKIVSMPSFNVDLFVNVMKQYKPTFVYCVPLIVNMAINHPKITPKDLENVQAFFSGAAPMGAADVQRFEEKTKGKVYVLQGYGMTETSPLTLQQTPHVDKGIKIGGSGLLMPNTDAKIIPVDGSSNDGLGPNQSGELLIRGPQNMKGYFNNPEATSEMLIEGGWLKTGDIAYYDEDQQFYITDRLKELIKVKGLQVAPAELEAILRDHPKIADAAVIGVSHPIQGEAPKAFVVLKEKNSTDESQIKEYVASKVSKHKHLLGGVVFTDIIPKNPSGKILRKELRKL